MGSVVHLRSAVALLGRFPVLAAADLDVDEGEIVLLEGPNGAGKTSLLRACAGLLPVSAGIAVVLSADLRRRQRPQAVGFLGHSSGLYDDLTAAENVAFRARLAGRREVSALAELETAGLEERLCGVRVSRLSAGQRRRVALAAVASTRPRLWLLDEPHAGLDAAARERLNAVLFAARSAGSAVLIASHETEHVAPLASRRVGISGGKTADFGELTPTQGRQVPDVEGVSHVP